MDTERGKQKENDKITTWREAKERSLPKEKKGKVDDTKGTQEIKKKEDEGKEREIRVNII